jgi:hypothetical protein
VLVVVVFVSCCGTVAIVAHVDSIEQHDTTIPLDYTMTVLVGQRSLWLPSLHSNISELWAHNLREDYELPFIYVFTIRWMWM